MKHQQSRYQAKLHGEVIGWYDTLAEAEAALAQAKERDEKEDAEYEWNESVRRLQVTA